MTVMDLLDALYDKPWNMEIIVVVEDSESLTVYEKLAVSLTPNGESVQLVVKE